MPDTSPTARALLTLELVSNQPGITADRLADRLGVTDRAARRYIGILREAGIPVESTLGRYGGYRIGRGFRMPPLMFTATEALGLVMAVLEGPGTGGPDDPVGGALSKIIRVLPTPVAEPVDALRRLSSRGPHPEDPTPDPQTVAALVRASDAGRRVRVDYRIRPDRRIDIDVDPWAVVVRHRRWYLLCWSHAKDAQRALRVDRVAAVRLLPESFTAPEGLDPMATLEAQLSQGWTHAVEVVVEAPVEAVRRWVPGSIAQLERIDAERTRLLASTDEPEWYAERLAEIRAPFHVVGSPEIRQAVREVAQRLADA